MGSQLREEEGNTSPSVEMKRTATILFFNQMSRVFGD